jgi:hypothetical protein
MNDFENMSEKNKFHLDIIGQIWGKMASEIYNQYLQRGRGVVVMFMMDDLPAELKAMLPKGAHPAGEGAVAAYVPRDSLLPLEDFVGEQGLLRIDHKLGQYDPDTTIIFAFIQKVTNDTGKRGTISIGYEISPPSEYTPKELYQNRKSHSLGMPFGRNCKFYPPINLN